MLDLERFLECSQEVDRSVSLVIWHQGMEVTLALKRSSGRCENQSKTCIESAKQSNVLSTCRVRRRAKSLNNVQGETRHETEKEATNEAVKNA
jgi:hypothetical protein